MSREDTLPWTYEAREETASPAGLEDYTVADRSGSHVGKVAGVLRHDDTTYLAVEAGSPPIRHDVAVLPWDAVNGLDHASLTVRLGVAEDEIGRAPRLDPSRKVVQDGAEASRVTDVPDVGPAPTTAPGPVDRPAYAIVVSAGILAMFAVLVLAIMGLAAEFTWHWALVAIPVTLLGFAGFAGYRLFRNPTEG